VTAVRLPLQNEVLRDLFTNELLRSLTLESAQFLLKGWSADGRVAELRTSDLCTRELFLRSRSRKRESVQRSSAPGRVRLQAALFVIAGRFTNESLGRGLNLDSLQSLVGGIGVRLQTVLLVVVGRLLNEVLARGCIRVVPYIGSRKRALENAGWR
jgi:hypothetical protein